MMNWVLWFLMLFRRPLSRGSFSFKVLIWRNGGTQCEQRYCIFQSASVPLELKQVEKLRCPAFDG